METEQRIDELQKGIQAVGERLSKFNPYHDTKGRFSSGSGGGGGVSGGAKERIGWGSGQDRSEKPSRGPTVSFGVYDKVKVKSTGQKGTVVATHLQDSKVPVDHYKVLLRPSQPTGKMTTAVMPAADLGLLRGNKPGV